MDDIAFVVIDGIEMDEFDAKAAGKCTANLKKAWKRRIREEDSKTALIEKTERQCTRNMPVWQSSSGHCFYDLKKKWIGEAKAMMKRYLSIRGGMMA